MVTAKHLETTNNQTEGKYLKPFDCHFTYGNCSTLNPWGPVAELTNLAPLYVLYKKTKNKTKQKSN